jgi:hypothetical protein
MKVSLTWLFIILIIAFSAYFFVKGCIIYESFISEPFTSGIYKTSDISLNTCPKNTTSYVDTNGTTTCCEGTVTGTTCNGNVACSLSGPGTLPSCSNYYGSYLAAKGALRCPSTMPNYYESANGSGCTSGLRTSDGTAPIPGHSTCKIYSNQQDDTYKMDSCTNLKIRDNTNCFTSVQESSKTLRQDSANHLPYVTCNYIDRNNNNFSTSCTNDSTYINHVTDMSSWNQGWQNIFVNTNNSEDPYTKLQFCSVAEPYNIQKRISLDDVIYMNVFTNYGGDPVARAARRKARIEAELQAAREKQRAAEQEAAAAREAQRAAEQKARIFGQQNQQIDEGKIQMMRNAGHSVLADHVISEVKQGRTPYYYGF